MHNPEPHSKDSFIQMASSKPPPYSPQAIRAETKAATQNYLIGTNSGAQDYPGHSLTILELSLKILRCAVHLCHGWVGRGGCENVKLEIIARSRVNL
ncbi:hypothetical protein ACLKA6_010898 [Drosophila palustris]